MAIPFQKWQALGNDYVILEEERLPFELTAARARRICEPHFGAGSDGVLLLSPATDERHVAALRIFNPDGSEAELSGNGAREAILYLRREGWTDAEEFTLATPSGEVRPAILSDRLCRVEMGRATLTSPGFPSGGQDGGGELTAAGRRLAFQHVSIGNPQCVIEAGDELETLDLPAIGPEIEHHDLFPNRTNVAFIRLDSEHRVRARIFERGVGETLSSGTGACASAIAAVLRGASSPVEVQLDGGELTVDVGDRLDVALTGWAEPVYAGSFSDEFTAALKEAT